MGKLLYGRIHVLYVGIGLSRKAAKRNLRLCVIFAPLREIFLAVESLRHADEVGEGVGLHFFHHLSAMELDCDFARS